ncbi:MAG: VCBS repeat-containing protein [Deltaproteobacteria bacterium]|nr:VCBS repeat-containing protein [Deltaproteobacteria bacterium]
MRPRLAAAAAGLLALTACGEAKRAGEPAEASDNLTKINDLYPGQGTARGGEEVCVHGEGLGGATRLWFGAQAQAVRVRSEAEVCATTPLSVAGVVPVLLEVDGAVPLPAGAFTFQPLELSFTEAASYYAPAPTGALMDGLVVDLDNDGLDDILTLDAAGRLAPWRSAGTGALVTGGLIEPEGRVGGLAALQIDGEPRVFLCHRDGVAPRVVSPAAGGLRADRGEAPAEGADCVGAVSLDLEGDGQDEIAELRADGAVRLWAVADGALVPALPLVPTDRADCPPSVAAGTASCAVSAGVATLSVELAPAAFVFSLPPTRAADAGLVLQLGGGVERIEVTDAAGVIYTWRPTVPAPEGAVERVELPPVHSWDHPEGAGRPARPLRQLAVLTHTPPEASILSAQWGGGLLRLSDGGEAPFGSVQVWPPDLVGGVRDIAAMDTDGDGQRELVVATASGPALYERVDDAFLPVGPGRLPAGGCDARAVKLIDIDEDGLTELFFTCLGQDLLFRGDGTGRYFDDSTATLPVDAGDGRGAATADLDLDGLPELLIATWNGVDRLYHGEGAHFADWSPRLGLSSGPGRRVLVLDLDGDDDLDIVVLRGQGQPARLLVMSGE